MSCKGCMARLCRVVVNVVLKDGLFAANDDLFKVWQLFNGKKWRRREDHGEMFIIIDDMLNIALFLRSREGLDDEGYSISHVLCLSSEEVVAVFRHGTSELVINELSIVSSSFEGILQNRLDEELVVEGEDVVVEDEAEELSDGVWKLDEFPESHSPEEFLCVCCRTSGVRFGSGAEIKPSAENFDFVWLKGVDRLVDDRFPCGGTRFIMVPGEAWLLLVVMP
eukprot:g45293.t1